MADDRTEIEWILQTRRQRAIDAAQAKEDALRKSDGVYAALSTELKRLGPELLTATLAGQDVTEIEASLERIEQKKRERILELGLQPEAFFPVFTCAHCEDTGRQKDGTPCDCKRQLQLESLYANDPSQRMLLTETFDNFDLSLFRAVKRGEEPCAPRQMMEALKENALEFVDTYKEHPGRNLLLYGPVGAGKSYLCHAMARALLDKGVPLVYQTSYGIQSLYQMARFASFSEKAEKARDLDLVREANILFIDDLGTESVNTQTVGYFFELINDRILTKRSTVISTNLEPAEIKRMYSPRVFSRIFGEFEMFHVFGDDLRLRY